MLQSSSLSAILCEECNLGDNEAMLMLCDQCDRGYHCYCVKPKLRVPPKGKWYCKYCRVMKVRKVNSSSDEVIVNSSDSSSPINLFFDKPITTTTKTSAEWNRYLSQRQYNTMYINNGSIWSDNERLPDSCREQRYLVKWVNYSYLHLSWESERHLLEVLGHSADSKLEDFIGRFNQFPPQSLSTCHDLRYHEMIPPEYIQIERIFDLVQGDDSDTNYYAAIPVTGVHGSNAMVSIKWRCFGYASFKVEEEIADLQYQDIDYLPFLKDYLKIESRFDIERCYNPRSDNTALASFLGKFDANLSRLKNSHNFPNHNFLHQYQWLGVQWLLESYISGGRGCLLADQAGLGKKVQIYAFIHILECLRIDFREFKRRGSSTLPSTSDKNDLIDLTSCSHDSCSNSFTMAPTSLSRKRGKELIDTYSFTLNQSANWCAALDGSYLFVVNDVAQLELMSNQFFLWTGVRAVKYCGCSDEKMNCATMEFKFFQDLSGDQSQSSGVGVNSGFKAPCVMVSYEDLKSDIEIFKSALWTAVIFSRDALPLESTKYSKSRLKSFIETLSLLSNVFMKIFIFSRDHALPREAPDCNSRVFADVSAVLTFLDSEEYPDDKQTHLRWKDSELNLALTEIDLKQNGDIESQTAAMSTRPFLPHIMSRSEFEIFMTPSREYKSIFKGLIVECDAPDSISRANLLHLRNQSSWLMSLRKRSERLHDDSHKHFATLTEVEEDKLSNLLHFIRQNDSTISLASVKEMQEFMSGLPVLVESDTNYTKFSQLFPFPTLGGTLPRPNVSNEIFCKVITYITNSFPKIKYILELFLVKPNTHQFIVISQYRLMFDLLEEIFKLLGIYSTIVDMSQPLESLSKSAEPFLTGECRVLLTNSQTNIAEMDECFGFFSFNFSPIFACVDSVIIFDALFDSNMTTEDQLIKSIARQRNSRVNTHAQFVLPTLCQSAEPNFAKLVANIQLHARLQCEFIRIVTKNSLESRLVNRAIHLRLMDFNGVWNAFPSSLRGIIRSKLELRGYQLSSLNSTKFKLLNSCLGSPADNDVSVYIENSIFWVQPVEVEHILEKVASQASMLKERMLYSKGQHSDRFDANKIADRTEFWSLYFEPLKTCIEIERANMYRRSLVKPVSIRETIQGCGKRSESSICSSSSSIMSRIPKRTKVGTFETSASICESNSFLTTKWQNRTSSGADINFNGGHDNGDERLKMPEDDECCDKKLSSNDFTVVQDDLYYSTTTTQEYFEMDQNDSAYDGMSLASVEIDVSNDTETTTDKSDDSMDHSIYVSQTYDSIINSYSTDDDSLPLSSFASHEFILELRKYSLLSTTSPHYITFESSNLSISPGKFHCVTADDITTISGHNSKKPLLCYGKIWLLFKAFAVVRKFACVSHWLNVKKRNQNAAVATTTRLCVCGLCEEFSKVEIVSDNNQLSNFSRIDIISHLDEYALGDSIRLQTFKTISKLFDTSKNIFSNFSNHVEEMNQLSKERTLTILNFYSLICESISEQVSLSLPAFDAQLAHTSDENIRRYNVAFTCAFITRWSLKYQHREPNAIMKHAIAKSCRDTVTGTFSNHSGYLLTLIQNSTVCTATQISKILLFSIGAFGWPEPTSNKNEDLSMIYFKNTAGFQGLVDLLYASKCSEKRFPSCARSNLFTALLIHDISVNAIPDIVLELSKWEFSLRDLQSFISALLSGMRHNLTNYQSINKHLKNATIFSTTAIVESTSSSDHFPKHKNTRSHPLNDVLNFCGNCISTPWSQFFDAVVLTAKKYGLPRKLFSELPKQPTKHSAYFHPEEFMDKLLQTLQSPKLSQQQLNAAFAILNNLTRRDLFIDRRHEDHSPADSNSTVVTFANRAHFDASQYAQALYNLTKVCDTREVLKESIVQAYWEKLHDAAKLKEECFILDSVRFWLCVDEMTLRSFIAVSSLFGVNLNGINVRFARRILQVITKIGYSEYCLEQVAVSLTDLAASSLKNSSFNSSNHNSSSSSSLMPNSNAIVSASNSSINCSLSRGADIYVNLVREFLNYVARCTVPYLNTKQIYSPDDQIEVDFTQQHHSGSTPTLSIEVAIQNSADSKLGTTPLALATNTAVYFLANLILSSKESVADSTTT